MWAKAHMGLIEGDGSAKNLLDDHADDRFDIRMCSRVVPVVPLRLAIYLGAPARPPSVSGGHPGRTGSLV
jgi:hypothetical protein